MYITYDLVEEMLALHDFHCVFELDAPMQIFTRLMLAEFKQCWTLGEIY